MRVINIKWAVSWSMRIRHRLELSPYWNVSQSGVDFIRQADRPVLEWQVLSLDTIEISTRIGRDWVFVCGRPR